MTAHIPAPILNVFVPTNGWPQLPTISQMAATRRQRREMRSLEDHILDDIGLTQSQADAEAKRPVWDVPAHWRRRDDRAKIGC